MEYEQEGKAFPGTLLLVMGTVVMLALVFCVMSINTCSKHLQQCQDEIAMLSRRTGCSKPAISKELFDVTVRIRTANGVGSGVIIGKDSILTVFHVVASVGQLGGTLWVDLENGKQFVAKVDKVDMARDLAIIKPLDPAILFDKCASIAEYVPNPGEPLTAIGAANGNQPIATQGFFAHVTAEGMYQMGLTAFWGNSGGPIFDSEGRVIGLLDAVDKPLVIQGSIIVPLHITFAVPDVWILNFLKGC
jgi:S1-C subfamily serine protease